MELQPITEKSFYKYLKCPSWLLRESEHGKPDDALLELLQDEGLLPEKERALLKDREMSEVNLDDVDEAAVKTLELMKEGVATIYKGVLQHGRYIGRPDVLERVEGKSDFGDYYYIAADIKRSSQLKNEYKFQGVFYAELLHRLQGMKPIQGYVIHGNGEIDNYFIEDFESQYHLTLDEIERILDEKEDAIFLTSGCKQSPWFHDCVARAENCRSLSLLNRIWKSEVYSLRKIGIETIDDLANAKPDILKTAPDLTMDRSYFLQQQAISLADGKIITIGNVDLPEPTKTVLVIDIETDPLHDAHYMFGVLVVDGSSEDYIVFTAERPEDEEENWNRFVQFLRQYAGSQIYHYGWYEVDVFRRLVQKYDAPDAVQDMFEDDMVDLLTHMRGHVIFPSPFYSLKDIAKFLGFNWRIKDASGLDSILWYEKWLETGDRSFLKDIEEYNEDDVRATWFVRNWVVNHYESKN